MNNSRLNMSNFFMDVNRNSSIFGVGTLALAAAVAAASGKGGVTGDGGLIKEESLMRQISKGGGFSFGGAADPAALMSYKSGIMDMHEMFH